MKTCPDCNGDGVVDKGTDDEQRCPTCGGSGFVPDNDDDHEEVLNTSHQLIHRVKGSVTPQVCSPATSMLLVTFPMIACPQERASTSTTGSGLEPSPV